ncbi:MAG: redoxin domain-containing protein [Ignavibacteria bacterium]|nr:redoxin domain-containing protein [Ignavibacteria bacterium]
MFKKTTFLAVLLTILALNVSAKSPGDKSDDFTLANWDGTKYNLTEALASSKNGVIVVFWSTECPWVQPYNDRINDYVKEMSDKGFTVWAINANNTESLEEVTEHAKKNAYAFPMLKDVNNVVADMLGATRTPEAFMISKEMVILYHGRISDNKNKAEQTTVDLMNAVNDVSAGGEVSVKETKSFGCGIKKVGQQN